MQTIYILKVRPSVKIPTGTICLDVGGERTFYFSSLEERQKALDWCRANSWVVFTGVEFVSSGESAMEDIKQDIQYTCDHFRHPMPELKEA